MDIRILTTLKSIASDQWNRLLADDFPFTEHAHLLAMEDCLGDRTGWYPFYVCVESNGQLLGASAVYLKTNSYGEFIFDHAWSNAYARSGISYFPKIVCSIPFTPATGEKILILDTLLPEQKITVRAFIIEHIGNLAREMRCSSVHHLFVTPQSVPLFESDAFHIRHSHQFHWANRDYENFDAFLETMKSKRRRQIQLERRQFQELGLATRTICGDALTSELADMMFDFYRDTNEKMGSIVCLTRDFFRNVFVTMKDNIVLFVTSKNDVPMGAAINFRKGKCMYGRYWGCSEDVRNMHFELCYYRALEYCIDHKIDLYEAGAQGEHKVARGFVPTITLSAHVLFDARFHDAVGKFLTQERQALADGLESYVPHLPYLEAAR